MRKRIFFLLHAMHVGGIEKALLRVLDQLPSKQWDANEEIGKLIFFNHSTIIRKDI